MKSSVQSALDPVVISLLWRLVIIGLLKSKDKNKRHLINYTDCPVFSCLYSDSKFTFSPLEQLKTERIQSEDPILINMMYSAKQISGPGDKDTVRFCFILYFMFI